MNEREFCYWLQGLFEVGGVRSLDETQIQVVKDHLALVFRKETPNRYPAGPIDPIGWPPRRPTPGKDFLNPFPWQPYKGPTCAVGTPDRDKTIAIC